MSLDRYDPQGKPPLLAVEHLSMRFGGLTAVDDLSFTAYGGDITAIIGPNGAGKTTVFNCLTGFYKPSIGRLTLVGAGGHPICWSRWKVSASRAGPAWRGLSRISGSSPA